MPIVSRSTSTDSSHLTLDIPTRPVPSALRTSFLQGYSPWIPKRCPNHFSLPNFVSLNHLMLVWRITLLRLLLVQLRAVHSVPNKQALCVISGLLLRVKKIFALLGCDGAQIDSYLPTFRDPSRNVGK